VIQAHDTLRRRRAGTEVFEFVEGAFIVHALFYVGFY
jgi:hypothetical protein